MQLTLTPVAFAALMAVGVCAQSSSSNSSSSNSTDAAPTSASSSSASSPQATSAASATSASACPALPGYDEGDAMPVYYGCTYNTTTTPVYDSTKLQSYLIGSYTRGPEGVAVEDVASQLAKSVTKLYPTLTVPFSEIAQQYETAISASITAARQDPQRVADGALTLHSNSIMAVAAAAVAVVAGGAFML